MPTFKRKMFTRLSGYFTLPDRKLLAVFHSVNRKLSITSESRFTIWFSADTTQATVTRILTPHISAKSFEQH